MFISHGHSDHTGGLKHFIAINDTAKIIVSPDALGWKFFSKRRYFHSITTEWPELPSERLLLIEQSGWVVDDLYVIAHIPQVHPMPKGNQHLFAQNVEGAYIPDDFRHELALYTDGLLFTGCAHSGLENILAASFGAPSLLLRYSLDTPSVVLRYLSATWSIFVRYLSGSEPDIYRRSIAVLLHINAD